MQYPYHAVIQKIFFLNILIQGYLGFSDHLVLPLLFAKAVINENKIEVLIISCFFCNGVKDFALPGVLVQDRLTFLVIHLKPFEKNMKM